MTTRYDTSLLSLTVGSFMATRSQDTCLEFVIVDDASPAGVDCAMFEQIFDIPFARTISDVAQCIVVPSYNYLAFYQGGATLDPHTDREACEYTVSLCIDATPDPQDYGAWPLLLMTGEGAISLTQGIGEALLFRGRYLTHWRERVPEGYTSSSILFHYVNA